MEYESLIYAKRTEWEKCVSGVFSLLSYISSQLLIVSHTSVSEFKGTGWTSQIWQSGTTRGLAQVSLYVYYVFTYPCICITIMYLLLK